jgi:Tol biopolymer transport system component
MIPFLTRTRRWLVLVFATTLLTTAPASAQYFGRNKVQYKTFDFQVLKTEHFDIYYYPEEREGIELAARMAERWHTRLQRILGHELRGRQPLVLYASHADFEQTNAIQGQLSEGTGGVTEALRRRIILPMGGPLADTDHVIGHELVHAFQFDITTGEQTAPGENGATRLPLWFIEGMAEYLSLGPVDPQTAMWLRDAAREEKLPSIKDLNDPKYFPYRWGQAFWAYVAGRYGDDVVGRMLRVAGALGNTDDAIKRVLEIDPKALSDDWHRAIREAYSPVLDATTAPGGVGTLAIAGQKFGGDLNVGPSISPDGKWIAFLSERELFSIDLFIADAATGKVQRRLTSTASDPHYSSIQFIYSAGGWSADSTQLAIATVTGGEPAIAIFDVASGERVRELRVSSVDEALNPTWAPDGRAIAFTGMVRGLTDLFVVDLASGAVRALTNDAYADLQPAWSPDGTRIAFATDRFTSNLSDLSIGALRLALIDPSSGRIEQAGGFEGAKNINPQWAPDSRTLYFITDRGGVSNLARVSASGGAPVPLTTLMTGITGITATSPALSVASQSGIAAFSVYDKGKYDIYTVATGGLGGVALPDAMTAAALPPRQRRTSTVQALLADARTGLPPADAPYETRPYEARLGIEAIGQPTVAVGADRFGTSVGGGISAYFRDVLGNHSLSAAVQVNSGITGSFSATDTGAQVAYLNQKHRWNWGVTGGQIPYLSGGFAESLVSIDGAPAIVDETIVFRQTERSAAGLAAYPLNRSQRLEFQAGASRISFEQAVRTQIYDYQTGVLVYDETETQQLADPLTLGSTSAAFVNDTSIFGATSPVRGSRARFEAAPNFGAINYTGLLVDYRKYMMPASFYTLAGRVMHYGRYGTGGDDQRLFPLYLGYPSLVRGYDVSSFNGSSCAGQLASDCVTLNDLTGSRMLVGNLEFRFPLLRPFTGVSGNMYGPLPVEVALFADGGVAWNRDERPDFLGGDRRGVASAGIALRANVFGFAVAEFDFSRPFQRRNEGWVFQFNLAPGF